MNQLWICDAVLRSVYRFCNRQVVLLEVSSYCFEPGISLSSVWILLYGFLASANASLAGVLFGSLCRWPNHDSLVLLMVIDQGSVLHTWYSCLSLMRRFLGIWRKNPHWKVSMLRLSAQVRDHISELYRNMDDMSAFKTCNLMYSDTLFEHKTALFVWKAAHANCLRCLMSSWFIFQHQYTLRHASWELPHFPPTQQMNPACHNHGQRSRRLQGSSDHRECTCCMGGDAQKWGRG